MAEKTEPPDLGAADNEKLSGVLKPDTDEFTCFPGSFMKNDKEGLENSVHDIVLSAPASAAAGLEYRRMSALLVNDRGFETGGDW